MMLRIGGVLTVAEIAEVRALIAAGAWMDGRATAGHLSATVKDNLQLGEDDPAGREAAAIILAPLARSGAFASAALPAKIAPPLVSRYAGGAHYGDHIDGAIRPLGQGRMRLDLSATLFLSPPEDYDGGALVIASSDGAQSVKLSAGDLLLYGAGAIHHVEPVTRGRREASFFWVQSLVRDHEQRDLLFALDQRVQAATDPTESVALAQIYHNLLRMWADC